MAQENSRKEESMRTIKKRLAFVVVLAFMLSVPSTIAYFYTIYPECSTEPCITGQQMNWTAELFNDGKRMLEYFSAEIVDTRTDAVIAQWKVDFRPFSSDRGPLLPLLPGHKVNITMQGFVPLQHDNNRFYYHPCFTHVISSSLYIAKYGEYENRHCYPENESIYVVGCIQSQHCTSSEFCAGNRCRLLRCGECQYIFNNSCVDYECCSDTQCSYNAQCINHTCKPIICMETQYLFNRTCIDIRCEESEIILNRSCIPLECAETEGYANHTCAPLECADTEFIFEHRCIPLECREHEYPAEHRCNALNCLPTEGYKDHQCSALECTAYQVIEDHHCVFKASLVTKYSVELIILALIGLFIWLDMYRYKHRKKGKTSKTLSLQDELKSFSTLGDDVGKLERKQ